jgi:hypothetical protein
VPDPKITLHSVGFFGSGKVEPATATALLNKDLPNNLGGIYRPAEITRRMATLSAVVDWLAVDVGEEGVIPSDDLIADLLERQSGGDTIALIAILPDEPAEAELKILKDARDNDIRVKDLAKALADVDFDVYFPPPAEEPEPEATAETPERTTGEAAASAVASLLPGSPYAAEALLGGMAGYVTALVYEILHKEGVPLSSDAARQVTAAVAPDALKAAAVKPSPRSRAKPARQRATAAKSELPDDEPPFDGPYTEASAGEKTFKYYVNPDGMYRLARGLPRRGEEVAELTEAKIRAEIARGHDIPLPPSLGS